MTAGLSEAATGGPPDRAGPDERPEVGKGTRPFGSKIARQGCRRHDRPVDLIYGAAGETTPAPPATSSAESVVPDGASVADGTAREAPGSAAALGRKRAYQGVLCLLIEFQGLATYL